MAITLSTARPSAPWRLYHRGKVFWCKTEEAAKAKMKALEAGRPALSERDIVAFAYAKQLLGDVPVLTAVKVYLASLSGESELTVSQVIEQHFKAATGRADYLEKKRYFLDKLVAAVGSKRIGAVTPLEMEQVVAKVSKSDWVRNNFLTHARVLFRYAVKMRLTRNDPTQGIGERRVTPSKVILTLDDTNHLLDTCAASAPDILPAVALQLFTGIRTSEVMRLPWSAVRVGEFVDVATGVSKTHERRVIDWWPPRLSQFITKVGDGTVVPNPASYEHHKWLMVQVCRKTKADFKFGQNCMRHSYASYAVAYFENAGRVALLMGQRDVNVLFRHYRSYCTQADAKKFFSVA